MFEIVLFYHIYEWYLHMCTFCAWERIANTRKNFLLSFLY